MSKAFENLLAEKQDELLDTMKNIEADITDQLNDTTDVPGYRRDIFTNRVIELLAESSVIPAPDHTGSTSYFSEHAYSATVRNAKVEIWGSALIAHPDDLNAFDLHLFITDYEVHNELKEITPPECNRLYNRLFQFYEKSKDGSLTRDMAPTHPAYKAATRIFQNKDRIVTLRCWLITNRIFEGAQKNGRRNLNGIECTSQVVDLKYLYDVLSDEVEISQSFASIGGLPGIYLPANEDQDYSCILSSIPGTILSQLYSIHGTAIVAANVRAYLGEKVKVNAGIQKTIEEAPARFLAYNNGLVISANSADFRDGRLMNISGIQIINGGQTTATIYQTWLTARNSRNGNKSQLIAQNLEKLRVPMKIVVSGESMPETERARFRAKISEAANSQNAVKGSDLAANHPFQIAFAKTVNSMMTPEGNYWFYEHARGLYKAELAQIKGDRVKTKRFKDEHPLDKVFNKTEFALAYMAWEGDALTCAKGQELAFRVFNEDLDERFNLTDGIQKSEAQALVCRWLLFNSLEKHLKKEKIVQNPRVPLLYAIRVLSGQYHDGIHWDSVWNRQALSPSFYDEFDKFVVYVDKIIRQNMGDYMIAMFGRQARCQDVIDSLIDLSLFEFDKVYEFKN